MSGQEHLTTKCLHMSSHTTQKIVDTPEHSNEMPAAQDKWPIGIPK